MGNTVDNANSKLQLQQQNKYKWSMMQFKYLADERGVLDRQMWQVPLAALGVAGLLLNAAHGNPSLRIMLCVAATISLYAAFFLARLHVRRKQREERMRAIEKMFCDISSIFVANITTKAAKKSEYWTDYVFGRVPTTMLGVCMLLLVTIGLVVAAIMG